LVSFISFITSKTGCGCKTLLIKVNKGDSLIALGAKTTTSPDMITRAGDTLSFDGDLDLRTGKLRWGTLVWYLDIVLSRSTDNVD